MIAETIDNVGAVPREVSADAGYYSAQVIDDLQALGVDPFVAPEKTRHGHQPPAAPRGRIPRHISPGDRMRRKLQTRRGRQRYALRMATVEPVFGQIKQGRGFRQFLLRGLAKVQGEWPRICTGHNLLESLSQLSRVGQPRTTKLANSVNRLDRLHVPISSHRQSSDGLLEKVNEERSQIAPAITCSSFSITAFAQQFQKHPLPPGNDPSRR